MSYSEEQSAQREALEPDVAAQTVAAGNEPVRSHMAKSVTSAALPSPGPATPTPARRGKSRQLGTRWWMLAAGSALLLTMLTIAAVYLLTRKPSTVDQLIILTAPSGANV